MFEEILVKIFPEEESGALFPPLCKNTDLPYEECDCEECHPTQEAADLLSCPACCASFVLYRIYHQHRKELLKCLKKLKH